MKKLLLIGLVVGGLAFAAGERADAQITAGLPGVGGLSFGFPGYRYAYPRRYNYYPYGYYQRPYYSYAQPYSYRYSGARYSWYNGHRTSHRHHRHNYRNPLASCRSAEALHRKRGAVESIEAVKRRWALGFVNGSPSVRDRSGFLKPGIDFVLGTSLVC